MEDKNTIASLLQAIINENNLSVRVVNCGTWGSVYARMTATEFREGDIILAEARPSDLIGATGHIDWDALVSDNEGGDIQAEWCLNHLSHCNHLVNGVLARGIYKRLEPDIRTKNVAQRKIAFSTRRYIRDNYIAMYLRAFAEMECRKGAIVMNCNPFTKGHRYLIEQALRQIDRLVVFVLQEDGSDINFIDRYLMVRQGTADLERVTVVPSGEYILSKKTFPEYFIKVIDEDLEKNMEYDIRLFSDNIAKTLGITVRFAGEESDSVTARYNRMMGKILPEYGISFVEIPRLESAGKAISASNVRDAIGRGDLDTAETLLPSTTVKYLEAAGLLCSRHNSNQEKA